MALFDFLGFNNPNSEFKGLAEGFSNRAKQFENLDSDFYKQNLKSFADYLGRQISKSTPTLNTLLSAARASGVSGTSSSTIANRQRIESEGRNREAVAGGVNQFYTGLAQTGLGYASSLNNSATELYGQYATGQRQAQGNQVGFANSILSMGATLGASALVPKPAPTNFNYNPYSSSGNSGFGQPGSFGGQPNSFDPGQRKFTLPKFY